MNQNRAQQGNQQKSKNKAKTQKVRILENVSTSEFRLANKIGDEIYLNEELVKKLVEAKKAVVIK